MKPALFFAFALTLISTNASAFCGFYVATGDTAPANETTSVVLLRDGTRTTLSMQNDYQGPPEDFAMVVPVPVILSEDDVKTLPREVFARIESQSAPRLVEYWEQDPCNPRQYRTRRRRGAVAMSSGGLPPEMLEDSIGVRVEAEFAAGEYDIVILSAEDSSGLDTWLRAHDYQIPAGAEEALRPYVAEGMKFFVAKVNVERVEFEDGRALLSPLRVGYESDTFSLPVRLGMLNATGAQDLLVQILARDIRYEVANYPNTTIPTNVELTNDAREHFGTVYDRMFAAALEQQPGAVVTEYAWQASSCDPCPPNMMTDSDLLTLGATGEASADRYRGLRTEFVLTRLHYRYQEGGLSDDLVFQEASAIEGGRERHGTENSQTAQPAGSNNFQARYIIRHKWEGPVECENPRPGIWGGPPGERRHGRFRPVARPAARVRPSSAAPANFSLTNVLAAPVAALSLVPDPPPGVEPPTTPPEVEAPAPTGTETGTETGAQTAAADIAPDPGCRGCATGSAGGGGIAVFAIALLLFGPRRRR